ncbi:MAG: AraC family transcriptional regulator [Gemmatimonadaceae bacterium]
MGIVAALVPHTVRLQRLRSALRGRHELQLCSDWAGLTMLCDAQPVHMTVIDLYACGEADLESLRGLRRRFPRLTIVMYVAPLAARLSDLFDMGRLGIDALILADRDDSVVSMIPMIEQAEARGVAAPLHTLLAHLHPIPRDAALLAVTRAHERLSSELLASTLQVTRRTLARHLEVAGLPTPQRLITWGRLIVAAHLMEDGERSFDRVARALHYPSGSAFRNMCQRYVKATPSEIRANGGAAWVLARMLLDDKNVHDADEVVDEAIAEEEVAVVPDNPNGRVGNSTVDPA